jgi:hypothetical protein
MRTSAKIILPFLFLIGPLFGGEGMSAGDQTPAQKRILMNRGEIVRGQRLKLVKEVIESYAGCRVLSDGNEMSGFILNGKTYSDFTIIIRDEKRTIIIVTADGVVTFDY